MKTIYIKLLINNNKQQNGCKNSRDLIAHKHNVNDTWDSELHFQKPLFSLLNSKPDLAKWSPNINISIFIYLPAFVDTGQPRGNVHERDSGPIRGTIPTQSHNP